MEHGVGLADCERGREHGVGDKPTVNDGREHGGDCDRGWEPGVGL